MSPVTVSSPEFNEIFEHLTTHRPPYRNMHLRDPRKVKRKLVCTYLHAMYAAKGSSRRIEGVISGPEVFLHYQIDASVRQVDVVDEDGDQEEIDGITERLLSQIRRRIIAERNYKQKAGKFGPKRTLGQYYLMRWRGGINADHPTCQEAVDSGVLDKRFIARLAPWDLLLFRKE